MLKKILQFILFLGIGVTMLLLVFRNQNAAFLAQCRQDNIPDAQCSLIDKLLEDFSTVHLGWMLLVIIAFTLSNIFRAARWQMLLEPLGYQPRFSTSLLTILLGYFANLAFPRMGEVVRAGTLSRHEKIPMDKVMGTLVVDRLMDFICLGLVVGLAFLLEGQTILAFIQSQRSSTSQTGGGIPFWAWIVLGAGVVGAVILWVFRKKWQDKVTDIIKGFWEGLLSVFKLKNPPLFIAYSLGIWLMFYLQCYLNLKAFPPTAHLGMGAALMVFVFGTLGFVIPSPGGMGSFHVLAIAGLALYGIKGSDAFSYANIAFFAIQILYNVVAGLLSIYLLRVINRK
jgi:glycosyltransferase 2 family protein